MEDVDNKYAKAAELVNRGRQSRCCSSTELGVSRSEYREFRRSGRETGAPGSRLSNDFVIVISYDVSRGQKPADPIRIWLNEHPNARVTALTNRFNSRACRYELYLTLPQQSWSAIRWRASPRRSYDETNCGGVKMAYSIYSTRTCPIAT